MLGQNGQRTLIAIEFGTHHLHDAPQNTGHMMFDYKPFRRQKDSITPPGCIDVQISKV